MRTTGEALSSEKQKVEEMLRKKRKTRIQEILQTTERSEKINIQDLVRIKV